MDVRLQSLNFMGNIIVTKLCNDVLLLNDLNLFDKNLEVD
jgi:hypothetical protein